MAFKHKILLWYECYGRDLPWRKTDNPYHIWISEIILQQTRIDQGLSYYTRFVEAFPTVSHLAEASEQEVLKLWQGLGYYSRARNLHAAAKSIVDERDGVFPDTYDGILALKGVGKYTAAAIASFAFRMPYPVIDGNVYRVISRVYGVYSPIGTASAYNQFEKILLNLIDVERPDLFNQAIMDFGSVYCKPVSPDCVNCIFASECVAYRNDKVAMLPVKAAPPKVANRYFYYFDIQWVQDDGIFTIIGKRESKDIWKGLYQFPLLEKEFEDDAQARGLGSFLKDFCRVPFTVVSVSTPIVHKLTHRTIFARFVKVNLSSEPLLDSGNWLKISLDERSNYPVSRLIDKYLNG